MAIAVIYILVYFLTSKMAKEARGGILPLCKKKRKKATFELFS